jgi:hypothetical protein
MRREYALATSNATGGSARKVGAILARAQGRVEAYMTGNIMRNVSGSRRAGESVRDRNSSGRREIRLRSSSCVSLVK